MLPWSFQIGSCALKLFPFHYFSFEIFETMRKRPADFMLWTGDHIYMLKPWQWESKDAMRETYLCQRNTPKLKEFMASRKHYAIWDDHDYGPNNAGSEFVNKKIALEVFKEMWPDQPQANKEEGVYFSFIHNDAQFFMLDGRYFKEPKIQFLGNSQLEWLCQELKHSTSKFKFICSGIQMLSDGGFENFSKYTSEYNFFMNYISDNKINGIVFLSGDVHYSEVSKLERKNQYPLYDFTFSPLTSLPINFFSQNSNQIIGTKVNKYNFGEISIDGDISQRVATFRCLGRTGKELWQFSLNENDLKSH